jgi:WD40 repeat protein
MLVRKPIKEKKEKPEDPKDAAKTPFSEEERDKSVGGRDITFEMRDVQNGSELWSRDFQDEAPRYAISQQHNTMLLLWHLDTEAAKKIIKADPALKAKASALGEKEGDLLVQLIDPSSGKVRSTILLETGEGSIRAENMIWAGDHLLVSDQTNRILVYSVSTGELTSRFFGGEFAVSTSDNRIAVENAPGRLAVYDLKTGSEITRLSFIKPVTLMRFVDDGKRFFVLTSDQTAFMFDTTKFSADDENKLGVNYPAFTGPQ